MGARFSAWLSLVIHHGDDDDDDDDDGDVFAAARMSTSTHSLLRLERRTMFNCLLLHFTKAKEDRRGMHKHRIQRFHFIPILRKFSCLFECVYDSFEFGVQLSCLSVLPTPLLMFQIRIFSSTEYSFGYIQSKV